MRSILKYIILILILPAASSAEEGADFKTAKFKYILNTALEHSADTFDLDKVTDNAYNALLRSIEPDSRYIPSKVLKSIMEKDEGTKYGIGISLFSINDTLIVVSSKNDRIKKEDKLIFIDGEKVIGKTVNDVSGMIAGELDSEVELIIKREKGNTLEEIKVKRDKYPVYSVTSSYLLSSSTVGYIKIDRFAKNTYDECLKELNKLKDEGMETLILDLRQNPGGRLEQVVKVASLFFPDSTLITYTKGRKDEYEDKYFTSGEPSFPGIPIVALVDSTTMSGGEMLAAAIQEYDRGILTGSQTFGKGSAQKAFYMKDSTAFRLTVAYYMTPLGRRIDRDHFKNLDKDVVPGNKKLSSLIKKTGGTEKANYVFTPTGRLLIETPGIIPDIKAYGDTLTKLTKIMIQNGTFMEYALRYYKDHKNILKKYNNFKQYTSNFKLSDEMLRNFAKVSLSRNIWNKEMFEKDKAFIINYILASVAYVHWGEEAFNYRKLNTDKVLIKAIQALPEAKKLLNKNR